MPNPVTVLFVAFSLAALAAFYAGAARSAPEDETPGGTRCIQMCIDCKPFCTTAPAAYVPPRP